jgi:hypothetical protein
MRSAFEIVKAHYDANGRKDLAGMIADIADDCQWTEMDGFPCRGTFIGAQEVIKNVFEVLGRDWDSYAFTLERLLDAGNDVVGIGSYTGTYKKTGKSMNVRVTHVWSVSDGKIRRFEQFTDTLRVADAMA